MAKDNGTAEQVKGGWEKFLRPPEKSLTEWLIPVFMFVSLLYTIPAYGYIHDYELFSNDVGLILLPFLLLGGSESGFAIAALFFSLWILDDVGSTFGMAAVFLSLCFIQTLSFFYLEKWYRSIFE